MDDVEFVEASDSEELEILQTMRGARLSTPAAYTSSPQEVTESPRKRRKLYHADTLDKLAEEGVPTSELSEQRSEDVGSSTPVSVLVDLPTSTAISAEDIHFDPLPQKLRLTVDDVGWEEDFRPLSQELQQEEPSEHIPDDIVYDALVHESQDELDVISQQPRQSPRKLSKNGTAVRSSSLGSSQSALHPIRRLEEPNSSPLPRMSSRPPDLLEEPDQIHDPSSLFSSQQRVSPRRASGSQDPEYPLTSQSSPLAYPRLHRFSSLPPSSPSHTSTSAPHTPQRTHSLSPGRALLFLPQTCSEGTSHLSGNDDVLIRQLQDELDNAPRRYTLRNRQPQQLKPYAYDKHQYKLQMRHIPDAIVKVVSPRRQHAEHGHTHRSHEPQTGDEYIAPEDEEESQVQRRGRASKLHDLADGDIDDDNGTRPTKWYPKEFELSDDELSPLPSLALSKPPKPPASGNVHESLKTKIRKVQKFPLREARARKESHSMDEGEINRRQAGLTSGIIYSRQKITHRIPAAFLARGTENGRGVSMPYSLSPRWSGTTTELADEVGPSNQQVARDSGDAFNDDDSEQSRGDLNYESDQDYDAMGVDGLLNFDQPSQERSTNKASVSYSSHSEGAENDNHPDNADDQSLSDDTGPGQFGLDSKKWKVAKRVLPMIMLQKLLGQQGPGSTKKAVRTRESSGFLSTHSSSDEDEQGRALVPGQSRIRKRLSAQREVPEVLGDSDSSEPEVDDVERARNDDGTSVLSSADDWSDSEMSSATFSYSEPAAHEELQNRGFFDEETGYFDREILRNRSVSGKKEDLIDRMLSRTRTGKFSKSKGRKRAGTSHSTTRSGLGNSNLDRAKNPALLDVIISNSYSHSHTPRRTEMLHGGTHRRRGNSNQQTRLPFSSITDATNRHVSDDVMDLTGNDSPESSKAKIADVIQLEQPKKLSRKLKREAAQRKSLFTVTGNKKLITSGRKKGFLQIQIDTADSGLREALAPLRPMGQGLMQGKRIFRRSESGVKSKSNGSGFRGGGASLLRQTSLHDFSHDEDTPLDDLYVRASDNVPRSTFADTWRDDDVRMKSAFCSIDMGISPLPLGLVFGQATYLGRQLLHDLLAFASGEADIRQPVQYTGFGLVDMDRDMLPARFSETLETACNLLYEWLDEEPVALADEGDARRYELLMISICDFAVWVFSRTDIEDRSTVQTSVSYCTRRLVKEIQMRVEAGARDLGLRLFAVLWFSVELTTRLLISARRLGLEEDIELWRESVSLLVQTLMFYGLEKTLQPIQNTKMEEYSLMLRTAELWICLIHLLPRIAISNIAAVSSSVGYPDTIWTFVLRAVQKDKMHFKSDVEVSEHFWRLIFSLSALSQFSAHGNSTADVRIPASWEVVALALETIRLTHDPGKDKNLPYESLKKRDKYVRMVVARCYLLGTKWRWSLHDAYIMFKKLVVIFKSRMFANLIGEESDFPAFLRYADLKLLNTIRGSDSAFSLFLKLVVHAAKIDKNVQETSQRAQSRLTKLLSLTVPLSGVSFSKDQRPVSGELSMVYNRYSAIIIAIYVEPTEANVRDRLDRARRYLNFAEADDMSRQACIRALMYTAILVQHLSLPLTEPLKWLGEMTETILKELQSAHAESLTRKSDPRQVIMIAQDKNKAILSIHLLLGCVRKILETPSMKNDGLGIPRYPDVGLISGPWIRRVFSMKELTNVATTRHAILRLVRSFLEARAKIIPTPRRPALPPLENPESQDLYDEFGLDDDVLAALDLDEGVATVNVDREKDKVIAEIMNTDVVPAILRLVLQYFNDPTASPSSEAITEEYWSNADGWIDCWVGCAAIVVRNGKRNWDYYLNVGPQSWGGISDSFFRRRVALRFMYRLLHCDSTAYKDHETSFLGVLLESLVAFKITMENEYLSQLFSIDGLRHPMLRELPVQRDSEMVDFHLSRGQFSEIRAEILEGIISNLQSSLERASSGNIKDLVYLNQSFMECIVSMLSAMLDIWRSLSASEDRIKYGDLCRRVFTIIKKCPRVQHSPRLATYVAWGESFDAPGR